MVNAGLGHCKGTHLFNQKLPNYASTPLWYASVFCFLSLLSKIRERKKGSTRSSKWILEWLTHLKIYGFGSSLILSVKSYGKLKAVSSMTTTMDRNVTPFKYLPLYSGQHRDINFRTYLHDIWLSNAIRCNSVVLQSKKKAKLRTSLLLGSTLTLWDGPSRRLKPYPHDKRLDRPGQNWKFELNLNLTISFHNDLKNPLFDNYLSMHMQSFSENLV